MSLDRCVRVGELTGSKLKKDLGAIRAIKRYHNKHRDGSGNFGFTIVKHDPALENTYHEGERWFNVNGDYAGNGCVVRLDAGLFSQAPSRIESGALETYKSIIEAIKVRFEAQTQADREIAKMRET
jgi:hypothetical protein